MESTCYNIIKKLNVPVRLAIATGQTKRKAVEVWIDANEYITLYDGNCYYHCTCLAAMNILLSLATKASKDLWQIYR